MSNLVNHAIRELDIAGYPSEPNPKEKFDYSFELRKSTLELVEQFAGQHHSGMSASIVTHMVDKLMQFEPLTPLTNDPDEWNEVELGHNPSWQSARKPSAFSEDGGKTYYVLDEQYKLSKFIVRHSPRWLRHFAHRHHTLLYPIHTAKEAHK